MARTSHAHGGYLHPFEDGRNFLYGVGENPRTVSPMTLLFVKLCSSRLWKLTELAMCQLSACLRAKDRWWEKYRVTSVRTRWLRKARDMAWHMRSRGQRFDVTLSDKQVSRVIV